jgi:hypothetical protein
VNLRLPRFAENPSQRLSVEEDESDVEKVDVWSELRTGSMNGDRKSDALTEAAVTARYLVRLPS